MRVNDLIKRLVLAPGHQKVMVTCLVKVPDMKAGTYTLTVTVDDAASCVATDTFFISAYNVREEDGCV